MQEKYGGACPFGLSKEEECEMELQCTFPPPPPSPPSPPATSSTVAFDLVVRIGASAGSPATLAAVREAVVTGAGVAASDVDVLEEVWLPNAAQPLASYAVVVEIAALGTDALAAELVDFATSLRVDAGAALPSSAFDATASNVVLTPSRSCPTSATFDDAEEAIAAEDYSAALVALYAVNECILAEAEPSFEADVYNLLGYAHRMSTPADYERSELFYSRALQVDPDHLNAQEYLAELYLQTDRYDEARAQRMALAASCSAAVGADSPCSQLDELDEAFLAHGQSTTEDAFTGDGAASSAAAGAMSLQAALCAAAGGLVARCAIRI